VSAPKSKKPLDEAKENPWRLFTAEELSEILGVSVDYILAAKKRGARFPGNKSRPEWVAEWLYGNPDFSLKG
jgi:hypothetical protein